MAEEVGKNSNCLHQLNEANSDEEYGSHQHAGTRLVLKCEWLDLLTMRECCCFESAPGIHWAKAKPQHMLRLKMESRESVASHCCSRGTCSLYVLEF